MNQAMNTNFVFPFRFWKMFFISLAQPWKVFQYDPTPTSLMHIHLRLTIHAVTATQVSPLPYHFLQARSTCHPGH